MDNFAGVGMKRVFHLAFPDNFPTSFVATGPYPNSSVARK